MERHRDSGELEEKIWERYGKTNGEAREEVDEMLNDIQEV